MFGSRCNTDRDRLRATAHRLVTLAIKAGKLQSPKDLACVDCGDIGYCYDHRDYHQPMLVAPVCRACNNRRGPGLPLPVRADNAEYKLQKTTGNSQGARWSDLDGGEGYDPLTAQLHIDVDLSPGFMDEAIGMTWISRASIRELGKHTWKARADWFKARDPWCV